MCNDAVRGVREDPRVAALVAQAIVNCNQWLGMNLAGQLAFARSVVGSVNLALRVRGTTATCAGDAPQDRATDPVAAALFDIDAAYPRAVNVTLTTLPRTIDPTDPDQCNERTASAQGGVSTRQWLADGLADCVAMGY
jgi:hypothetical protein